MSTRKIDTPTEMAGEIRPSEPPSSALPQAQLPGSAPRFVLLYHPDLWECTGGEILPRFAIVRALPGIGGNGPGDTRYPSGAVAAMAREGWREVPDNLEHVSFGETRRPSKSRPSYADWYESKEGGIWSESWVRPRILGGRLMTRVDRDGKRSLQRAVSKLLPEPTQEHIELALREPLSALRNLMDRAAESGASRTKLRAVAAQVPLAYHPPEIRPYLASTPDASEKSR